MSRRPAVTLALAAFIATFFTMSFSQLTDPAVVGQFQSIGVSNCVGVQMVAVPGTTDFLFMERPMEKHPDGQNYNACLKDGASNKTSNIKCGLSMENCGHTYLKNGTVAVLAGHKPQSVYPEGRRGVQILDLDGKQLKQVGQLQFGHWLATATRLPTGHVTIMSDSPDPVGPSRAMKVANPFYELWNPENPASTTMFQLDKAFTANTKYFYYPFNFVLPTGDMFVWSNQYGQIINPLTGKTVLTLPNWRTSGPKVKGMNTAYPFGGTAVMLPLTYKNDYKVVEIMVFGGQWAYGWINTTAVDLSMRLKITITKNGTYDVGQWQKEVMPSPRVTGTSVLLPNGKVLLINGAKRGLMGDAAAGGVAMCHEPNFWPALYDPAAPEGQRYTELGRSQIARLLHSTAGLTLAGSVMVAGGDRSDKFWSPVPYSASPTGFPEFRVELFHPPDIFRTATRPKILRAPATMEIGDIQTISFSIANTNSTVDSVVLVAPPSNTHTFDMHQRVVELRILGSSNDDNHVASGTGARTVTVAGPPSVNVTLPGPYMLFLVSGGTYSEGVWVTVAE